MSKPSETDKAVDEGRRRNLNRLNARITKNGDCWEWDTMIRGDGYGSFHLNGKGWLAHRASYVLNVGPIPDGLDLDHLCRNRRCVNPSHLEPVTRSENLRRSPLMGRYSRNPDCPKGHEFTPENTQLNGNRRNCRACNSARWDVDKYNPIENCDLCGKSMRRGSIKTHKATIHSQTKERLDVA